MAFSGSVALLGDTLHNVADALTAVPLGTRVPGRARGRRPAATPTASAAPRTSPASSSSRPSPPRRWSPDTRRSQRLSIRRPSSTCGSWPPRGVIGFVGNELVARYRIRVGRRIGSAALVADGLHARTDGFTSLAVLRRRRRGRGRLAAGPTRSSACSSRWRSCWCSRMPRVEVYRRLMDAVDPSLVDTAEDALAGNAGRARVGAVRLRWIGHPLRAEASIVVDPRPRRGPAARDRRRRRAPADPRVPRLTTAIVHADPPCGRRPPRSAVPPPVSRTPPLSAILGTPSPPAPPMRWSWNPPCWCRPSLTRKR